MSIQLEETTTYEEAEYATFSGKFMETLNLTENKLYELHANSTHIGLPEDYYVLDDLGRVSFSSIILSKCTFYRTKA
jgi:hypothetical protein